MEANSGQKNPAFFINLFICIVGTLVILWFAFGVERKDSPAQKIFVSMLQHSGAIIAALAGSMVLILIVSYMGMKRLKDKEKGG